MQQLSGLDAAFVQQDSPRTPMHVCAVLLYDVPDSGPVDARQLQRWVADRLAAFPLFRRRLQQVPLAMDTPYWVDVERPDHAAHIAQRRLPAPGGWRELMAALVAIHSRGMDLSRPLWEMHLLDGLLQLPGLPPHCQALVLKVHHAAIDGVSLAAVVDTLHRHDSEPRRERSDRAPELGLWDLWTRAGLNNMGRQLKLAGTVGNLLPGLGRVRRKRGEFADLPAVSRRRARFNDLVTGRRSVGAVLLPLAQVLEVRRAVRRVTLNDIAMSVVSGALRHYLGGRGQLPEKTLSCGAPVNLREPGERGLGGNRIATMNVGLATHIADPVERLRLVHRYAVAGKKQLTALGSGTIMDISDSVAPRLLSEGIRSLALASRYAEAPVPFHTLVSNVPGPQAPLYLGEASLLAAIGLGPIRDNMGLFHIVSGGPQWVSLGFSACRKLLPDSDHYEACLQRAFDELLHAARTI